MQTTEGTFEGWVIIELLGHRKLGGYLKEQAIAGANFLRLDIPTTDGKPAATQFYAPSAVYCITPVTEQVAIGYGSSHQPLPVQRWELPAAKAVEAEYSYKDENEDDPDY